MTTAEPNEHRPPRQEQRPAVRGRADCPTHNPRHLWEAR